MKLMIASDLHGSGRYVEQLLRRYREEQAGRLLLLGDLLYHGPRNSLPDGYSCPDVIDLLNGMQNHILAVRGNCDSEVDQMVLQFPITADYSILEVNGLTLYATHGHLWNENCPPRLNTDYILLNGHTHIPACNQHGNYIFINPGSTSIPKGGSTNSYLVLEDRTFTWKTLAGEPYRTFVVPEAAV